LKEISLEVAELLVKSRAKNVELEGLVNVSPEVLRTLNRCRLQRGRDSELELRVSSDVYQQMKRLPRVEDDVNR
jgi:hypothetical protein